MRTRFASGEGLQLDEQYRLAHLPLIAPDHSRVIATQAGKVYMMGRHPETFSLVLPIPGDALLRSAAFQELDADLRSELHVSELPEIVQSVDSCDRRDLTLDAEFLGT
ncbi:hypothetical protein GGE65_001645 [Skermanella aerolata]|uniref:hypothetical protein n=1 Tax=Skermanella aerolata TaxID=393310 RepID=UPI003D252B5E